MKNRFLIVLMLMSILTLSLNTSFAAVPPSTGQAVEVNEKNPVRIIDFEIEVSIEGTVIINYIDEQRNTIREQEKHTVNKGTHTFSAKEIPGYVVNDETVKKVEIKSNGEVKTINFNYRKAKGTVIVDYIAGGEKLSNTETYIVELGEHTYRAKGFEGYKISAKEVETVSISKDKEVKNIVFGYDRIIVEKPVIQEPIIETIIEPERPEPTPNPVTEPDPIVEPEPIEPEIILGTVKGQILKDDGEPLRNLKVELHSDPLVTYTDENGNFEFKDIELGEHTLYLSTESNVDALSTLKEINVKIDNFESSISNESIVKSINEGTLIAIGKVELTEEQPEKVALLVATLPEPLPEPITERNIPVWPIIAAAIIAILAVFRRKNLTIYELENNSIVTKMRVSAKPTLEIKIDKALKIAGTENIKLVFNKNTSKRLVNSEIVILNEGQIMGVYKVPQVITGSLEIEVQKIIA